MNRAKLLLPLVLLFIGPAAARPTDDLDQFIQREMARRHIPGLSIAVIEGGKIVEARGYGVIDQTGSPPVTPQTLFQAGSISKSVAALGALHLVEAGKLALDSNVNTRLRSWKVPDNQFTAVSDVTLRRLLSHTAGLTVHGFPGYAIDEPVPTLVQVLDGAAPANTAPIRVDTVPGSMWRYSGGGYTVMQQMMLDVTGQPFPAFMRKTVLDPVGMKASGYEQPLPPDRARATATGHYPDRTTVKGRWHVYPEMAAAGLWTTPSDLARFAIEVQRTYTGQSHKVISTQMAHQMLTDQRDGDGLGVFLQGTGPTLRFGHNGRDEGFDAMMTAYASSGQGAVIMINANDDSHMVDRILRFLSQKYHWPDAPVDAPSSGARVASVAPALLTGFAGRYEFHNNQMITLVSNDTALETMAGGFADDVFSPEAGGGFVSSGGVAHLKFLTDAEGSVTGVTWKDDNGQRVVPRVGPLISALQRQPDPDTAFTGKVIATLGAMGQGQAAIANAPYMAPGARLDFQGQESGFFDFVRTLLPDPRTLTYLGQERVAGRGIERHGGQVDRIVYYDLGPGGPSPYLMIYVTPEGLITDYDPVDM
jgi:CubicO group peptidase (beta-lactamase class C family)